MDIRAAAPVVTRPDLGPRRHRIAEAGGNAADRWPADAPMPRPPLTEARGVAGDVLVRAAPFGEHPGYALSEIPGPDQIRFTSLADAARQARDYTRHRGVDVWTDDGAGHVVPLSRFRASGFLPNRHSAQAATPSAAACAHADAVRRDLTDGPPPS